LIIQITVTGDTYVIATFDTNLLYLPLVYK
jgi:hypothetical protein